MKKGIQATLILIIAVIIAVASYVVLSTNPKLFSFEQGGLVLAVTKQDYNNIEDSFDILMVVSGTPTTILTGYDQVVPSDFPNAKPDSVISISLTGYDEACKYTQGQQFGELWLPEFKDLSYLWWYGEAQAKCGEFAGDRPHIQYGNVGPGASGFQCVAFNRQPYYSVLKNVDFKAVFTVEYKGQKATAGLNNAENPVVSLKLPSGQEVGFVEFVGSFNSLRSTCDDSAYSFMSTSTPRSFISPSAESLLRDAKLDFQSCIQPGFNLTADTECRKALDNATALIAKGFIKTNPSGWVDSGTYEVPASTNTQRPLFLLHLYTSWVKIERPICIPSDFRVTDASDSVKNSEKSGVGYSVKNTGTGACQFNLVSSCDVGFAKTVGVTPLVQPGQTVTGTLDVPATCGATTTKATCTLIAQGTTPVSGSIPQVSASWSSTCIAATECTPDEKFCGSANELRKCDSSGKSSEVVVTADKCGTCTYDQKTGAICSSGEGSGSEGKTGISLFILLMVASIAIAIIIVIYAIARRKR